MTSRGEVYATLIGMGLCVGLLGIAVTAIESCHKGEESRHEQKAAESKGKADAHAEVAGKADTAADEAHKRADEAEAEVERLRAALARVRNRPQPVADPAPVDPAPAPAEDLAPVVAAQDALIKAQDGQIVALKAENVSLTVARDHWRAAFSAERDRATSLHLALEAQKAVTKGALWRGRFQGVAVGLAAGYVSGRLH